MRARVSITREFLIAVLVAVWLHVGLFFVFVLLLVYEVLAGKVLDATEFKEEDVGVTELNLEYEEDLEGELPAPLTDDALQHPAETKRRKEEPKPRFVNTQPDQENGKPEDAGFIGERNTMASSNDKLEEGEEEMPALAGEEEVKDDIKTATTDFSDGEKVSSGSEQMGVSRSGEGSDSIDRKEIEASSTAQKMVQSQGVDSSVYEEIDGVEEMVKDRVVPDPDSPLEKAREEMVENVPKENQDRLRQDEKKQGGRAGAFQTKQTKTRISGTLNAIGKGSLNVENTALGRYEAKVFRMIEREWQARNFQYRSHLAPGFITLRFLLNGNGKVRGQRKTDMRGASDIQWGIVLDSVSAAEIPAMPQKVLDELGGESLELTVTFNY